MDEETFQRVFGGCDWAVMFILARGGKTHCRLRFNTGPGAAIAIPTEVDYSRSFPGSDLAAWKAEYAANVHPETFVAQTGIVSPWDDLGGFDQFGADDFEPLLAADLLDFDPAECEVY